MGSTVTRKTYIGATNIISSLGFSTNENFKAVEMYTSGIKQIEDKTFAESPFLVAKVDRDRLLKEALNLGISDFTTLEQMLILSINEIITNSGIDLKNEDCAIIFSTTKGNIDALQLDTISLDERVFLWKMAERVSNYFEAKNKPLLVSNACISGVSATIIASRLIREGKYNHVFVAGGDLLTPFVYSGFTAFKSVSTLPCIP